MDEAQNQRLSNPPSESSHPRRPPAHKSVSLLHTPRATPQPDSTKKHKHRTTAATSNRTNSTAGLASVPTLANKTGSSGESSNAEKWFEKSNRNVCTGAGSLIDNDPPFFLRNSSSVERSPDVPHGEELNQETPPDVPQYRPDVMLLDGPGSSSEDFRSVIDDLTIQNKKLKRRLKKYERLHDSHLQGDKLFEIRVHGLPPDKKRELENTLRNFAATLAKPQPKTSFAHTSEQQSAPLPMEMHVGSSLGNADSAYASLSGLNSSSRSGQGSNTAFRKAATPGMYHAQQQNVHTYLSDIPAGLLPIQSVPMTDKAKRKLVVKRLEQIFAGKGASMGGHQHPIQQEEISQSAARDDRTALEGNRRWYSKEGAREARIMPLSKEINARELAAESDVDQTLGPSNAPAYPNVSSKDFADPFGKATPEQRPTRPLDLDPNRAQIPEDNIKYLRHLGFSPMGAGSEEELIDGHGYMYLNVLINMAQLHTVNVTPEFVKKSLEQYSNKLELSADGRKVRWKGGSDLTHSSSNGSPDDNSNLSRAAGLNTRTKGLSSNISGDTPGEPTSKSATASKESENKMAYVPLFFHRAENTNDDSDDDSSGSTSPGQGYAPTPSSGFRSSSRRTSSSKRRQANDGPIIFYNKAPFVTDLSGDWRGANVKSVNLQNYFSLPTRAVGMPKSSLGDQYPHPLDRKQPLLQIPANAAAETLESDSTSTSGDDRINGLSKPASIKTRGSSSDDCVEPMDFEVSGLGGVQPSDNFSINITSRHKLACENSTYAGPNSRSKTYPPHIKAIFTDTKKQRPSTRAALNRAVEGEIVSSTRKDLPASELPAPSYFLTSSQDDEDEEDEYTDSEAQSTDSDDDDVMVNRKPFPMARPQLIHWPSDESPRSDEQEQDDDDLGDDESSDGSVDMLDHVRNVEPELIRLAEREYDSTIAERLAEEIPAGSSAATAGGGSGFNSPEKLDGADSDVVVRRGPAPTDAQRGILKRGRGSDDRLQRSSKSPKLE